MKKSITNVRIFLHTLITNIHKLIVEKEFVAQVDHLRPWTEKAMKIEVAPWIREYVVDMNELYTELTLEKAEYTLDGEQCQVLESY